MDVALSPVDVDDDVAEQVVGGISTASRGAFDDPATPWMRLCGRTPARP
jgi:hypothetical protein